MNRVRNPQRSRDVTQPDVALSKILHHEWLTGHPSFLMILILTPAAVPVQGVYAGIRRAVQ